MAKRPAFLFYPAEWKNNAKLRRCSEAARGAWMDILCTLHDSDEYGVIRWSLEDLARSAGVPLKLAKELVQKDVLKGGDSGPQQFIHTPRHAGKDGDPVVLVKSAEGPCWYSTRMVRDEWLRGARGGATRFGSDNQPTTTAIKYPLRKAATLADTERARLRSAVKEKTSGNCYHCGSPLGNVWEIDHFIPRSKGGKSTLSNLVPACVDCNQDKSDTLPSDWITPTGSPTGRVGDGRGDGLTSSFASSSSKEISSLCSDELELTPSKAKETGTEPNGFSEFYAEYPRKAGRGHALKGYERALKRATPHQLLDGARRYAASRRGEDPKFTKHPATWLSSDGWLDDLPPAPVASLELGPTRTVPTRQAGENEEHFKVRRFKEIGLWLSTDGAPPGNPDCCMPRAVLGEFGFTDPAMQAAE